MTKSNLRAISARKAIQGHQINWNAVYYFSEIAAAGSIKEAALKLELTPSTLSLHLSQLEDDLEVQLFHRGHRKLTLTEEGARLYRQAKAMFEEGQRWIDLVSPVALGGYPVSVGLVPSPSIQIANRVLSRYLTRRGALDMKLLHTDYQELEKGLADARFDFGFSDRTPERNDIAFRKISESHVKFFVAPKWSELSFAELLTRLPLLICNAEPNHRSLTEQRLIEADWIPSAVVTSDYPSMLIDLCQQGAGIGVFSEAPLRRMGMQGLMTLRVPPDAPRLQDHLYALWPEQGAQTAAVRELHRSLDDEETL